MRYWLASVAVIALTLMMTGCGGSDYPLRSQLSEQNANDIIAALDSAGIPAQRQQTGDGITVSVAATDTEQAVKVLNAAGLPRRERTNLGAMFKKDGIISTPFDEKARYIYSLSQELESTLDEIDGVVAARVQVVLPDRVAPGERIQPASASVFIKHAPSLEPDVIRPQVMQLVAASIPGMAGEQNRSKLSVVFVPAQVYHSVPRQVPFGFWMVSPATATMLRVMTWLMVLIALTTGAVFGWRRVKQMRAGPGGGGQKAGMPAAQPSGAARPQNVATLLGLDKNNSVNDQQMPSQHADSAESAEHSRVSPRADLNQNNDRPNHPS